MKNRGEVWTFNLTLGELSVVFPTNHAYKFLSFNLTIRSTMSAIRSVRGTCTQYAVNNLSKI